MTTPPHPNLSQLISNGEIGVAVVVGAGVAGLVTTQALLTRAEAAGRSLRVVLVDDGGYGPSQGSGGLFLPFSNPDPRIARWAIDSFHEWDAVLGETGLAHYRRRLPSLMLSRRTPVPIPLGHAGFATPIDPRDFDLPFWPHGAYLDDGAVISACTLMPRWRARVHAHPAVIGVNAHLRDLADLNTIVSSYSADVVCLTLGPRASHLISDQPVDGDVGVLIRGSLAALPEMFRNIVLMDEDADHELTYAIPHDQCGHVLFGGKSGDLITERAEFLQLQTANTDIATAPRYLREALDEAYQRIRDRMPVLAPALPADPTQPGNYWFGVRPRASRVLTQWRWNPSTSTPMLTINGLGGSGFTITPAVIRAAFDQPLPPECPTSRRSTRADDD